MISLFLQHPTVARKQELSTTAERKQSQQHKSIYSTCPNNSASLLRLKVNPNTMMGFASRGSLFIDTIKLISHGPACKILIYSEHYLAAQKASFIFLMPFTVQNTIQHKQGYKSCLQPLMLLPIPPWRNCYYKPELNSSPTQLKELKYHFNQQPALCNSPVPSVNTFKIAHKIYFTQRLHRNKPKYLSGFISFVLMKISDFNNMLADHSIGT